MGKEIERKYLVKSDGFVLMAASHAEIRQAYLSTSPEATVRVRIYGDMAYVTVKSKNKGTVRNEWEYEVPRADAVEMMDICGSGLIEKVRYIIPYEGHKWEVDVFGGRLRGLILAEIELSSPDEEFAIPPFIGREVTGDPRYYNSNLAQLANKD